MKHFRAFRHLPYRLIDFRKECISFFNGGMNMSDDKTIGISYCLGVDLTATDDEAAWIPDRVGNDCG